MVAWEAVATAAAARARDQEDGEEETAEEPGAVATAAEEAVAGADLGGEVEEMEAVVAKAVAVDWESRVVMPETGEGEEGVGAHP